MTWTSDNHPHATNKMGVRSQVIFADDTHPRWVTGVCQLDYDTMAGADKFGEASGSNCWVLVLVWFWFLGLKGEG